MSVLGQKQTTHPRPKSTFVCWFPKTDIEWQRWWRSRPHYVIIDASHRTCRAPPLTDVRRKMRQLGIMLLLLALAGCSSSGDWFHREEPKPEPLTDQTIPQIAPQQAAPNKSYLSPAASAVAPTDVNERNGELMDCVTESCKINCSPKVAVRSRPKWCAGFKQPI